MLYYLRNLLILQLAHKNDFATSEAVITRHIT